MRPHRGSRAMSTMGAKVQFTPAAAASRAAARAARCAAAGPGAARPRATSAVKQPSGMRIGVPSVKGRNVKRGAQSTGPSRDLTNSSTREIRDANTLTGDALMSRSVLFGQLRRGLLLGLVLVASAAPAGFSQTSTGSVRGYVK